MVEKEAQWEREICVCWKVHSFFRASWLAINGISWFFQIGFENGAEVNGNERMIVENDWELPEFHYANDSRCCSEVLLIKRQLMENWIIISVLLFRRCCELIEKSCSSQFPYAELWEPARNEASSDFNSITGRWNWNQSNFWRSFGLQRIDSLPLAVLLAINGAFGRRF